MLGRLLSFLLLQAVCLGPVFAEDQGETRLSFKGTAPAVCAFSALPRTLSAQNMAIGGAAAGGATVAITEMVDNSTARLKRATISLAFQAVCNVPHELAITSVRGGLTPVTDISVLQGAFLTKIHYRASAHWGAAEAVLVTSGNAGASGNRQSASAQVGELTVEIRLDETDNDPTLPVIAGTFDDILTISITARL